MKIHEYAARKHYDTGIWLLASDMNAVPQQC